MKTIFLLFLMMTLSIFLCAIEPPEFIYSIEVGSFGTLEEAEARKTELSKMGFSPVSIVSDLYFHKVILGEFSCNIDAFLASMDLNQNNSPDLVMKQPNTEKRECKETIGPFAKIFDMKEKNVNEIPELKIDDQDPDVKMFMNLLNKNGTEELEIMLNSIIRARKDDDAVKGWAMMHLGRIKIEKGERSEVFDLFIDIATGKVSAPKQDRIEAMFRVARIYKSIKGGKKPDWKNAYRAFTEIDAFLGDAPGKDKGEALLALAGLTKEMRQFGNDCSWSEVYRACKKVLEFTPPECKQIRATAELIYAETFFRPVGYEGNDNDKALSLFIDIVDNYPDQRREIGWTICWICEIYQRKHDWENAKKWALKLLDMNWKKEELVHNIVFPARALYTLCNCEQFLHNPISAIQWKDRLLSEYPDTEEAEKIRRSYTIPDYVKK
jgi:tetratricopeptide (TPR) repeat protein